MRSLHLDDCRPKPAQLCCEGCGHQFPERDAAMDRRGDPCCPRCGSLRLDPAAERGGRVSRFLLRYSQV